MKVKKLLDIALALILFAALAIPFATADFEGGKVSATENRYLARFPQVIRDGEWAFRTSDFDSWINDNLGGRGALQTLMSRIDYALTRKHDGDVIEGKEQWLYLFPEADYSEYMNDNLPDAIQVEQLVSSYEQITQTLAQQDIAFVLAMYPRKYHVYPEYMPDTLHPACQTTAYMLYDEALRNSGKLNYVATLDILRDAKAQMQTFSKAHMHPTGTNMAHILGIRR